MFSPDEEWVLHCFADIANKGSLHAVDWEIFFEFLIAGHNAESPVDEVALVGFLREQRFPQRDVDRLADFYVNGRDLLAFRDSGRHVIRPRPDSDLEEREEEETEGEEKNLT